MTSGMWPFPSRSAEDYFTVLSLRGPDLAPQGFSEKAALKGNPPGFSIPGKGVSNHDAKSKDVRVGGGEGRWVSSSGLL